ncbi:MAG: bacillithiol biosynthesis cysteine-adding enzyme BshC [Chlorobi bacterium]|nr:bacillithiol biosynthesis cysteine-adding enzyme BshC [Chlorobiota bacterium]
MHSLSWCRIPGTSALVCDYVSGNQWLEALFAGEQQRRPCNPHAIVAIEATMAGLALSAEQRTSIEELRVGKPVVISGQQVGHFGGPLYTWLKVASLIVLARQHGAVPVFWVEDNDHDIAEAQRIGIITPNDETVMLDCPTDGDSPEQTIVATCRVGEMISEQLTFLRSTFDRMPWGSSAVEILSQCYQAGRLWSDAFIELHHRVWSRYGVVFVRSSVLRTIGAMGAILERDLRSPGDLAEAIVKQTDELVARGYSAQLHAADVNVFFHTDGRRFRIHRDTNDSYRFADRRISHGELLDTLHREPERFSPSAALRPLVQDALFAPTVTVLGPAELQYHAQLRSAYQRWNIPKATLYLRCSGTIVPSRVMRVLDRHTENVDVFVQPNHTFDRWLSEQFDNMQVIERAVEAEQTIRSILDHIEHYIGQFDPTLVRTVRATSHAISSRMQRLEHKVRRAVLHLHQQQAQRYRGARVHLFPNGGLQERSIAPIHWVCSLGIAYWGEVLLSLAQRANCTHYIATPDELLGVPGTPVVTKYV